MFTKKMFSVAHSLVVSGFWITSAIPRDFLIPFPYESTFGTTHSNWYCGETKNIPKLKNTNCTKQKYKGLANISTIRFHTHSTFKE